MALIECTYFSDVLGMSMEASVILPQRTIEQIGLAPRARGDLHPTLYLLHGLSDDHTAWMRYTSIERYASERGIAVVMPAVHRSWYTDQAVGLRYWTYVSEELPALMRDFFPLSAAREDNFVAGLSMGGYGAFKWALRNPESVAAAASLSGGLDVRDPMFASPERTATFGDSARITSNGDDLFELADRVQPAESPALYQWCGTEDFLYDANVRFRDRALERGLPLKYEEGAGDHGWEHWDAGIRRVLDWLPLRASASVG